jgi:hypothetical protein
MRKIRYGDYCRETSLNQRVISYNQLAPRLDKDAVETDIKVSAMDAYRMLRPYIGLRLLEQLKAVVPLGLYLMLFQLLILRQVVENSWSITAGLFAVIIGLMLFMEGLKLGLMPFGEIIGNKLPQKSTLPVVLLIAFLLGVGVTFAEPAIGALKAVGSNVPVQRAPYLYALLNLYATPLVLMVGGGVGLAAVLGTLRFLNGWSLKPMIYAALLPTLLLSIGAMLDHHLAQILGLAWDAGAVTTGPITVPLVLSLGIGIAAAAGRGSSSLSGFGIVTLASLFPIAAVLILAYGVRFSIEPQAIIAAAAQNMPALQPAWYEQTPAVELILAIRAIVPLVLFLAIIFLWMLKERLSRPAEVYYGLTLTLLGMMIFNIGLSYGLSDLGTQTGGLIPAAFQHIDGIESSPLYFYALGVFIAVAFAWILGFGATLAEPALNALGMTVENLTQGAFRKNMLMMAVSTGVALGIALGVVKILYDVPIMAFLLPAYLLAVVLTWLSDEAFVNVAWDSAGVTTGPITVPLVLAMGLGLGNSVNAIDGFGILALASIGPILTVLIMGLYIHFKVRAQEQEAIIQS